MRPDPSSVSAASSVQPTRTFSVQEIVLDRGVSKIDFMNCALIHKMAHLVFPFGNYFPAILGKFVPFSESRGKIDREIGISTAKPKSGQADKIFSS
jgi:hypothetical protein